MTAEAIHAQSENPISNQAPDWFDENHDSLLILLSRDSEENGVASRPEASCYAA